MGKLCFAVSSFGQALVGQHILKLYSEVTTKAKGMATVRNTRCVQLKGSPAKQSAFSDQTGLERLTHLR